MKQIHWHCGMLVPERYARRVTGEPFEQHAEFLIENGREAELEILFEFAHEKRHHRLPFSIDLNQVSESTWPIVFANTPIFGNLSISVQPVAGASVFDKVTVNISNRSLLKSEQREEMLRAAPGARPTRYRLRALLGACANV